VVVVVNTKDEEAMKLKLINMQFQISIFNRSLAAFKQGGIALNEIEAVIIVYSLSLY